MRRLLPWLLAVALAGCATTPPPYVGQGPHPQVTRGHPLAPIDALGNVFAVLTKLILWNWKVDNHNISAETEDYLVRYIDLPASSTDGTLYSLNEYAPGRAFKRLVKNRKVAWPYRLLIGFPVTLLFDVLIPGRLFAGLINGDAYNPYTDIVSLYSDLPAIALHEAGHTHDFNKRRYKGTYAFIRLIPFVDLFQEYKASQAAFSYLIDTQDYPQEIAAYKILYPAYGTYVGGYIPFPGGGLAGALVGHVTGRSRAATRQREIDRLEAATEAEDVQPAPAAEPAAATP